MLPSKSAKATDAAAGPLLGRRINHPKLCLALLLAVAPHPSSANLLTKMNLGKAGGVASAPGGGGQPFELLLPEDQLNQDIDVNLICDATRGNAFKFDIDRFIDDEEGKIVEVLMGGEVEVDFKQVAEVEGDVDSSAAGAVDSLVGNDEAYTQEGTRSLLAQGKAMPTKARGVDVLLSIQDILKGAQVFEHVKLFTTLKASKPNKFAEKDDTDGVVLRGHAGASASGDDQVIAVLDHVAGESDAEPCTSGFDTLTMLGGVMLITVLLLVSSVSWMSFSSNQSFYYHKTFSSKKKTSKLGAWKVLVIALFVSCCLVRLGTANDTKKVLEVDQRVEQIKLRGGAVAAETEAVIQGYEEQDEVDIALVSDADKEESKDGRLLDPPTEQTSIKALEVGDCGSGCTKGTGSCTGDRSCIDAGDGGIADIGADSCTGFGSCVYAGRNGGTAEIDANSCTGASSCFQAGSNGGNAEIGANSCTQIFSCEGAGLQGTATIGANSCNGTDSCWDAGSSGTAEIGNGSCTYDSWVIGTGSCYEAGKNGSATIGANSCTGTNSCWNAGNYGGGTAEIGVNSCTGTESCYEAGRNGGIAVIGANSCTGERSCWYAGKNGWYGDQNGNATIGNNACTIDDGCMNLNGTIPDNCPSIDARERNECAPADGFTNKKDMCISGISNKIRKLTGYTRETCAEACANVPNCKGIQWFTETVSDTPFNAGDCMLSSRAVPNGCDNDTYQVDFYGKKCGEEDCSCDVNADCGSGLSCVGEICAPFNVAVDDVVASDSN